jgi:hypothetical protein
VALSRRRALEDPAGLAPGSVYADALA